MLTPVGSMVIPVGLPPPGSTITNAAAPDHRYSLAGSYSNNNVVMVDADTPSAVITLAAPGPFGVLSLLCTAGHGPVTNQCVIHHANGLSETNTFIVSDWLSTSVAAFSANGRDSRRPPPAAMREFSFSLTLRISV